MSNNRITPFIKRMRTNGGTIYTFSSAVEDIGLNINERNNIVKISHFALLDIPEINDDSTDLDRNLFNIKAIDGAFEYEAPSASIKDGRVLIAESFQNYALNFEANLLNRDDYDPTLIRTVSERVLWKWLKETGAIRWQPDVSTATKKYWSEEIDADGDEGYNSVVKYIGRVSAGNVRTDTFGTYNETYLLVPTSHGQTDAYFEIVEDDNYKHGMEIGDLGEKILGRESYTLPHPDALSYNAYYDFVDSSTSIVSGSYTLQYDNSTGTWTDGWWFSAEGTEPSSTDNAYLTDSSAYQNTGIYNIDLQYTGGSDDFAFRRSKVDSLSLVFDLPELKEIYADSALTYDKMAIEHAINDNFNFNAVLVYYEVQNSTGEDVLGRNLLGILFLDAPSGNSSDIGFEGITIPSLEKIQSGPSGFGTSYSLRLNIKTDNMVDDTGATIVDMATSDQLYAEDWTAAFANLNTAVNLLTQNTSVIQYLSGQYTDLRNTQTQILNDIEELEWQVNDISRDITGTPNVLAMFADGDDPIVDSSVYMKFGRVGIREKMPEYPFHISGTTKADDIIIENSIKDTSGNIILGYGSPLHLGSSTNYREVEVYSGNSDPAIRVDTSNNVYFNSDISIGGNLSVDGSTTFYGDVIFDGSITSSAFDFSKEYLTPLNVGAGLVWDGNYFNADVSAFGASELAQLNDVSIGGAIPAGNALVYVDGSVWTYGSVGNVRWYDDSITGPSNSLITANPGGTIWPENWLTANFSTKEFVVNGHSLLDDATITGNLDIQGLLTASLSSASTSNVLYYNTGSGAITYGAAPSGGGGGDVQWASGNVGSNNYVITANGDGSIVAESGMTFSSGTLSVGTVNATTITGTNIGTLGSTIQGTNVTSGTNPGHSHTTTSISGLETGDITSGIFPVSRGGTGINSATANYMLTGNGTNPLVAEANLRFTGTTLSLYNGAPENIRITNEGYIYADQNIVAYSSTISDRRLKENIEPLSNSLDKILHLQGISYTRKKEDKKRLGLIAQEVEPFIPEVITEQDIPGEGRYKTINYEEIIPHLIESIKEQQQMIGELQIEIENLKNK